MAKLHRLLQSVAWVTFALVAVSGALAQTTGQTSIKSTTAESVVSGAPRQQISIEVFANSDTMVTNTSGYDVTVHRVDAIRMLELELERGLPPNEREAAAVLQARMKSMGLRFAERTKQGQIALSAANSYGLRMVPAVVFNGKAIVYGVADIPTAIRMLAGGRATPVTNKKPNPLDWKSPAGGAR